MTHVYQQGSLARVHLVVVSMLPANPRTSRPSKPSAVSPSPCAPSVFGSAQTGTRFPARALVPLRPFMGLVDHRYDTRRAELGPPVLIPAHFIPPVGALARRQHHRVSPLPVLQRFSCPRRTVPPSLWPSAHSSRVPGRRRLEPLVLFPKINRDAKNKG